MPMRNYLEGYYTLWHQDLAFPLMRESLATLYPDLHTLPSVDEGREWRAKYTEYVALLRSDEHSGHRERIDELYTWLRKHDALWSPPPHLTKLGTP
eukprot:4289319-Karenia_brevis.AAC.1